mmetsp:Transcript_88465/g.236361  ORF Transcript_88465/g.236361 Transcript_88465/m.236361 type:complete len:89 (-) Transcript_88465:238-504(-)
MPPEAFESGFQAVARTLSFDGSLLICCVKRAYFVLFPMHHPIGVGEGTPLRRPHLPAPPAGALMLACPPVVRVWSEGVLRCSGQGAQS